MKQFGIAKFAPKPKTEKDWTRVYARHRYEVPNVKKISLTLSSKGAGQTGARYVNLLHLFHPICSLLASRNAVEADSRPLLVEIRNTDLSAHIHSHFKAYAIPPIKYWNPNVEVAVQLDAEKAVEPVLTVEFSTFI